MDCRKVMGNWSLWMLTSPLLTVKKILWWKRDLGQLVNQKPQLTNVKLRRKRVSIRNCVLWCVDMGKVSVLDNTCHHMGFKLTPTHLRTVNTDDLEDVLTSWRSCVNGKNTSSLMEDAAFGWLQTCEVCAKDSPMNKNQNNWANRSLETGWIMRCMFRYLTTWKQWLHSAPSPL